MLWSFLSASAADRRYAIEKARYARQDHGEHAQDYLRSRVRRVRSRRNRRIYHLAIRELRRVRGSGEASPPRPAMMDGRELVAAEALAFIAGVARQIDDTVAQMGESQHRRLIQAVASRLRAEEASLRARIAVVAKAHGARHWQLQ